MRAVHVVVPDGVDDPLRPSGGNSYDRKVRSGLRTIGWAVHEHALPGSWPRPDAEACAGLQRALTNIPDGALVLLDGLIASTVPDVLLPESDRLHLVVLVHMPLGAGLDLTRTDPVAAALERAVLSSARAVITTSEWTRHLLLERYELHAATVYVAQPGAEPADLAPGTQGGAELLCVAAVTQLKGHDLLLAALSMVADLPWHLVCVGSADRDKAFVAQLQARLRADGISDRVDFTGALVPEEVDRAYAEADALVVASRAETYGMAVTEALAHGLPVVATDVGGVPEALGSASDGSRPGLLVTPDDPVALASTLRRWLVDAQLRERLRQAARDRRRRLTGWSITAAEISRVLESVA